MTDHDPAPPDGTAPWQLQVQVTRPGPDPDYDPARQWVAAITAAPETPGQLAALLREAATQLEDDGPPGGGDGARHPYLTLAAIAEDIAAVDDLDTARAVLRRLHDPSAEDKRAAVVHSALLGRAQSVLAELAALTRRLAGVR